MTARYISVALVCIACTTLPVRVLCDGSYDMMTLYVYDVSFWVSFVRDGQVIPFHSELPKEDQMLAFAPVGEGVVKIVVATNSAESSITMPDVDNVICLGSCKEVPYVHTRLFVVLGALIDVRVSRPSFWLLF